MASKNRLRDSDSSYSAVAFFLSFIFGSITIVVLKSFQAPQVIVTVIPVLIMIGYALLISLSPFLSVRSDQAGDNLYYLGFLYTLVSLAVSLYQFSPSSVEATSIITNFGVAIATTITGLALRVLFAQIRTDPIEVERTTRIELAEVSRRLRGELDSSVQQFSLFVKELQQLTNEGFRTANDKLIESLDGSMSRLEESVTDFTSVAETAREGFGKQAGAVQSATDSFIQGTEEFERRLHQIEFSERLFEKSVEPALERLADSTSKVDGAAVRLSERIDAISFPDKLIAENLMQSVVNLNDAAAKMAEAASRDEEQFRKWAEFSAEISVTLDRLAVSAAQSAKSSEQFSAEAKSMNKLGEDIQTLLGVLRQQPGGRGYSVLGRIKSRLTGDRGNAE